ncbi:hypothetical protein QYE76_039138 [Lolium multiflorum]|uniref:Uncharacterized protein n=1 Tax=Lolium multiflorum TaxID=4521 RepID=A0AAD8T8S8_LOLMU|nr:hypothetical protein QYE76_039138 [Lolium multiflorum]
MTTTSLCEPPPDNSQSFPLQLAILLQKERSFKLRFSGSQPPKAPRVIKKKAKPSPASFPITPEVEVPPKASSASKPDPKDVIDLDDLPEDPAHHGDSTQGTSSPIPPPDQPSSAFAGPTDEEQEQKVKLLQVTNATRVSLQPTPLQKLSLAQRYAEVSAMLNKVWGKPDEEVRDLEDGLKVFFAKHKEVRRRKRKHSSLDELSAKVKVLEAENESLRNFMKESSSKETEARKELSEKHAREKAELIDKLEKSQASLGFEWTKDSNLTRTEAYDEARMSIDALFEACRGIATALSLKKAKTTVIDTMTKLMRQVPEFIKDQKSSARGAASLVLATCKAFFPSLNLAQVTAEPQGSDMDALSREMKAMKKTFVSEWITWITVQKHNLPKVAPHVTRGGSEASGVMGKDRVRREHLGENCRATAKVGCWWRRQRLAGTVVRRTLSRVPV